MAMARRKIAWRKTVQKRKEMARIVKIRIRRVKKTRAKKKVMLLSSRKDRFRMCYVCTAAEVQSKVCAVTASFTKLVLCAAAVQHVAVLAGHVKRQSMMFA